MKRVLVTIGITIASLLAIATPVHADVNDFKINNYDIDYTLGRDSDGRSTLHTVERITATFPNYDQNHGLERYIPKKYDGHDTSLNILSVKNQNQQNWEYSTHTNGEYTVLRIGSADSYVQGEHTFEITYTQRDVTKVFENTGASEFYWDTNGTEWQVPIGKLDISLTIDPSLQSSLTGASSCYFGSYGSSQQCDLLQNDGVYKVSAESINGGQNITVAVGFESETFSGYKKSLLTKLLELWWTIQFILMIVAVPLLIILTLRYKSLSVRKKELGTIVPEYLPPKDSSVSVAATLVATSTSFSAQIIDFAVRHYIKIYEKQEAKLWKPAVYGMEIVKPIDDLATEEKELIEDIFSLTAVGTKIDTESMKKDYGLAYRLVDNPSIIKNLKRGAYGIQEKNPEKSAWFKRFGVVMIVGSVALLSPVLLSLAIVAFIMSSTLWVLTDKGLALYRYLQGLKMYISVAEVERFKMLQSPEGANKVQVDLSDPKKLVELYEKLLPYAILFGQEKEWNKRLGDYYQSAGVQPDWYSGANMAAFNAAAFSSAMSNLNTSINSTGAGFSSSGGSSGGGFSGGGGGGGGGGGW